MQHEGSHEVNALLVAPTTNFTGGHHELDPVSLIRHDKVLITVDALKKLEELLA